ncbi:MAG: hypothetical protein WD768_10510 [Phycisphaeraceae bacterium]
MRHLFTILLILAGAASARACNVPVFRYALENWPADAYEVWVFHDQPLTAEQSQWIADLRQQVVGRDKQLDSFFIEVMDVSQPMPDKAKAAYAKLKPAQHPWLVVQFPHSHADDPPAFSGLLTKEMMQQIADSPTRRRIAKGILEGQSAVWLLIESGDKAQDDAAAALLTKELTRLEKELVLPTIGEDDKKFFDPSRGPRLRIAFEVLRLSREAAGEAMLLRMLEGWDPKLTDRSKPMAFAFFGLGRVLPPLVGDLIEPRYIEDASIFLVGRCSCQIKNDNPGWDVLMPVEWDGAIEGSFTLADAKPILTTAAAVTQQNQELTSAAGTGDVTAMMKGDSADGAALHVVTATGAQTGVPSRVLDPATGSPVLRNLLIVAGAVIALLLVGTVVLKSRREG